MTRLDEQQAPHLHTWRDSVWETGLVRRGKNWQVDMVVTHLPGPSLPSFSIAIYRLKNNPNSNPSELVQLSMEEARLLRDVLNRPEMQRWLEDEGAM